MGTVAGLFLAGHHGPLLRAADKPKCDPRPIAEKLIGKWKLVLLPNGGPPDPSVESTIEYFKDGTVVLRYNSKKATTEERGKYSVAGDLIFMAVESRARPAERYWQAVVVSVSDDELSVRSPEAPPRSLESQARLGRQVALVAVLSRE